MQQTKYLPHELDDDGCCIYCGFDGAAHWHWANSTYEGMADEENRKLPVCKNRKPVLLRTKSN